MPFFHNRVSIAGNLTRDPELRQAGQSQVAVFSLAVNRRFKVQDEQRDEVLFIDCEAWGRTAELAGQYLVKGRNVFIEGRLKLDSWEDKEGKRQSRIKLVCEQVQFLPSPGARGDRSDSDDSGPQAASAAPAQAAAGSSSQRPSRSSRATAPMLDEGEPPF